MWADLQLVMPNTKVPCFGDPKPTIADPGGGGCASSAFISEAWAEISEVCGLRSDGCYKHFIIVIKETNNITRSSGSWARASPNALGREAEEVLAKDRKQDGFRNGTAAVPRPGSAAFCTAEKRREGQKGGWGS